MPDIIQVTPDNIEREHICCAITEKKGETCVADKKAWMAARFADGLVFRKLDARGKVFIEYLPAEKAWVPIDAPGWLYIDCLWVSGQYKGQGYAKALLNACIEDAKAQGKQGLVILSGQKKKMPFMADPKFLTHEGFQVADTAEPYFALMMLPLMDGAPAPRFRPIAKEGRTDEAGLVLYYTNQCPYANTYAQRLQEIAVAHGCPVTLHHITTMEEAQACPSPFTSYSLFDRGAFVTNEILSEKKFTAYLEKRA